MTCATSAGSISPAAANGADPGIREDDGYPTELFSRIVTTVRDLRVVADVHSERDTADLLATNGAESASRSKTATVAPSSRHPAAGGRTDSGSTACDDCALRVEEPQLNTSGGQLVARLEADLSLD